MITSVQSGTEQTGRGPSPPGNIIERRSPDMKKTYVLDTSVIIHDFESVLRFQDNTVVVPVTVLGEIDGLKKAPGEVGYAARSFLRLLDSLHTNGGDLHKGIHLPEGGTLIVVQEPPSIPFRRKNEDNFIIATADHLSKNGKGFPKPVIMCSNDASLRFISESIGLEAQEYRNDKVSIPEQYGKVFQEGGDVPDIRSVQYMISPSGTNIYRVVDGKTTAIKRGKKVNGIAPRNIYQECAFDALLCDDIDIVVLSGKSGSAKTLMGVASGLYLVDRTIQKKSPNMRPFDRLFVTRPTVPVGDYDLGFLPGSKEEKLDNWLQAIFDNMEVVFGSNRHEKDGRAVKYTPQECLTDQGLLEVESLGYIRGRSLRNRFMLVDEFQNGRKADALTLVTRAGENSKICITGDPKQIDSPFISKDSCALNHVISRFIQETNFCYLSLPETARSRLAEQGARLL
jgi:PhoH-like ATPase